MFELGLGKADIPGASARRALWLKRPDALLLLLMRDTLSQQVECGTTVIIPTVNCSAVEHSSEWKVVLHPHPNEGDRTVRDSAASLQRVECLPIKCQNYTFPMMICGWSQRPQMG